LTLVDHECRRQRVGQELRPVRDALDRLGAATTVHDPTGANPVSLMRDRHRRCRRRAG